MFKEGEMQTEANGAPLDELKPVFEGCGDGREDSASILKNRADVR